VWAAMLRQVVSVDVSSFAKWLIVVGLGLAAVGALVWLASKIGLPLGGLPGDIRFERPGFSFRFPLATCIVVSIVLTVIANIVLWVFRR
jgi:hypothetical protein